MGQAGRGEQDAGYRALMKERLTQRVEETRLERLRDRVAIGSEAFARRVRESFGKDLEGREQKRDLRRRVTAKAVRVAVERVRGGFTATGELCVDFTFHR